MSNTVGSKFSELFLSYLTHFDSLTRAYVLLCVFSCHFLRMFVMKNSTELNNRLMNVLTRGQYVRFSDGVGSKNELASAFSYSASNERVNGSGGARAGC